MEKQSTRSFCFLALFFSLATHAHACAEYCDDCILEKSCGDWCKNRGECFGCQSCLLYEATQLLPLAPPPPPSPPPYRQPSPSPNLPGVKVFKKHSGCPDWCNEFTCATPACDPCCTFRADTCPSWCTPETCTSPDCVPCCDNGKMVREPVHTFHQFQKAEAVPQNLLSCPGYCAKGHGAERPVSCNLASCLGCSFCH